MKKCPFCAEEIQDEAIKCRWCSEMLGQAKSDPTEERILIEQQPAFRGYTLWMFLGILLSVVGIGIVILLLVALHRAGQRFIVTNTRVVVRKGLFSKQINEINISDIRSIDTRQTFWDRIVGCGDIQIGTAGTSGKEINIVGIIDPVGFKDIISSQKSYLILK